MRTLSYLFLTLLFFTSCNESKVIHKKQDMLISNITIIDVETGKLLENRNVIIDSGRIKGITIDKLNTNNFDTLIDGTAKYLMPGLAEMHRLVCLSAIRVKKRFLMIITKQLHTIK